MKSRILGLILSLILIVALAAPKTVNAWDEEGTLIVGGSDQGSLSIGRICADGAGGAFICYTFQFNMGGDPSLHIERIDGLGVVAWPSPASPSYETSARGIVPDYAGGAFLLAGHGAVPNPISSIYRLTGAGSCSSVFTWESSISWSDIIPDGSGGALVAEVRALDDEWNLINQILVQKIDSDNNVEWSPEGIAVCSDTIEQYAPRLVADGSGGAIVTWCDDRDGRGIYAQRISSVGTLLWAENGVPICIGVETMYSHKALPDGAGGAIIVWWDSRSGNSDIYAQRIDSDGDILWAADGIPVCSAAGDQELPYIITDGSGGAIIAWLDGRAGNSDIYAQRIDPSGAILWTADGVPVASGSGDQESHQVVEDGGGGAIIVWIHDPEGTSDIMAQKMSSGGTLEWPSAGVPVCTIGVDITKIVMTGDGAGNAIVAWDDLRTPGVYGEIYAALISDALTDAIVPGPGTAARLHQNYPNPFNPATMIEYYLSESGPVTIEIYDVAGRLVTRLLDGEHREQGPHGEIWDGRDENGRDMVSGVYIYRLESGKITLSRKMLLLK